MKHFIGRTAEAYEVFDKTLDYKVIPNVLIIQVLMIMFSGIDC
jgi:hypothetical protein